MKKNFLITMAILTVVTGSSIVYANPDAATTAAGTAAVVSTLVANDAMKASTEPTPTNLVSGKTPRYDETIYNYYADITGYKENSLWGFKDPAGNILVKPTYKNIEAFNEELIKVQANNGKYGLINLKGKAVLPAIYTSVRELNPDYYLISQDWKYGITNSAAKVLISPQYKKIDDLRDDFFKACNNTACGVVNSSNKTIVPFRYENIETLGDNLFKVKYQDKWGVMSDTGNSIIASKYDNITMSIYGYIKFKTNKKWGAADTNGKIILEPEYGPFRINWKLRSLYKKANN